MLAWTQDDLAVNASVAKKTIADFETGKRRPYDRTIADIKAALERGGVLFIDQNGNGPGVRLRDRTAD